MKTAEVKAMVICKGNTFMMNEPEVKEIIKAWQKDIDASQSQGNKDAIIEKQGELIEYYHNWATVKSQSDMKAISRLESELSALQSVTMHDLLNDDSAREERGAPFDEPIEPIDFAGNVNWNY